MTDFVWFILHPCQHDRQSVTDLSPHWRTDPGSKQCYFSSLNHLNSTSNTVPNTLFYFHFLNLFTSYSTSDSSFWIVLAPLILLSKSFYFHFHFLNQTTAWRYQSKERWFITLKSSDSIHCTVAKTVSTARLISPCHSKKLQFSLSKYKCN